MVKLSRGLILVLFLSVTMADPLFEESDGVQSPLAALEEEMSVDDRESDVVNDVEPLEDATKEPLPAGQGLEAFLSQFILIKTPYGYILARAPLQEGIPVRATRYPGRNSADSNFQLRVRKSDPGSKVTSWTEMLRDRKAAPFKAQHNFQLRVRKSSGPEQEGWPATAYDPNAFEGLRVRKAILEEIRDRRRSVADHSNKNFQLRVRKSAEQGFSARADPGKYFQLRVRRSINNKEMD